MRIDDELHRIAGQVEVNARALLLDDPALGIGRALGPEDFPRPGVLAPRPAHLSESITPTVPVLLFEPGEALALRDTRTGLLTEMQTEMIIAAGLPRLGPTMVLTAATGWSAIHDGTSVELRAADGGLWARGYPALSRRWLREVELNAGHVLAFYGLRLGVRVPPDLDEDTYSPQHRAEEFRTARAAGLVAGGIVTWKTRIPETAA
jgi:hypothetical protein